MGTYFNYTMGTTLTKWVVFYFKMGSYKMDSYKMVRLFTKWLLLAKLVVYYKMGRLLQNGYFLQNWSG